MLPTWLSLQKQLRKRRQIGKRHCLHVQVNDDPPHGVVPKGRDDT